MGNLVSTVAAIVDNRNVVETAWADMDVVGTWSDGDLRVDIAANNCVVVPVYRQGRLVGDTTLVDQDAARIQREVEIA
ncbi:hypothetical protein D3C84_1207720 [compost metagenome]